MGVIRVGRFASSRTLLVSALALCAFSHSAKAADTLIEGARQCTAYFPKYEREYGIPTHLLSAIASTESGRFHEGLRLNIPWPWTINVEGKGYFFASKQEAIQTVRAMQMRGSKSIDVGCMQVNLLHHPRAFSSLDQAFDPQSNVAYAASFLRSLYEEKRSWKYAAAYYHSRTPSRGTEYVGMVYNNWYKILDKLREAKLRVGDGPEVAMAEPAPAPYVRKVGQLIEESSARSVKPLPEQRGKKLPEFRASRMKVIELSRKDVTSENGVAVYRPQPSAPKAGTLAVAEVKSTANIIPAVQSRVIQVETPASPDRGDKKTGPTFIFQ